MSDHGEDGLRLDGGPYADAVLERDAFGGRLPNSLCVTCGDRVARYELDIDAQGPFFRFTGWRSRTPAEADWDLLRFRTERARDEARALRAEGRIGVTSLARTRARTTDLRIDLQEARRQAGRSREG